MTNENVTAKPADLRDVMVGWFCDAAKAGTNIAVVVSDSTSTAKIGPFAKEFPDRVVNVGIAEQDLVGVAAGLSLGGFIPFTCNAAPFLVGRANEQVKNDICYSRTNVKLVGLNAGVCYGPLGSTHHAIDDISIMRGFGAIQIFAPSDPIETRQVFEYATTYDGPVYIRLDSASFPVLHGPEYRFTPGKVDRIRSSGSVAVVALGSVVHEAVDAATALAELGVETRVISAGSIRPLDRTDLLDSIRGCSAVVTVEEHTLSGGLGSLVCEAIAESGTAIRVKRLGFPEGEWPKAGPRKEMRAYYGIDAAGIIKAVRSLV